MATRNIPNVADQKIQIAAQLEKTLKKGDIWFVVDATWFKQWKCYVGYASWGQSYVGEESSNPGPIDNAPILEVGSRNLKANLVDGVDYGLIPEDGWYTLVSWYGLTEGHMSLPRRVIEDGVYLRILKVEVYPWYLHLCENSRLNEYTPRLFSMSDTIKHLEKVMRAEFNIADVTEVRLWNRARPSMFEPLNRKHLTLQAAGLYQGQVIVIEEQNFDGTWPRNAKPKPTPSRKRLKSKVSTQTGSRSTQTYIRPLTKAATNTVAVQTTPNSTYTEDAQTTDVYSSGANGGIYAPELGSEFDGSIKMHLISTTASQQQSSDDTSDDEEDEVVDHFEVVLRFKSRHGGYNTKLLRVDQRLEALKWRFFFRNKDHFDRLAKALARVSATFDSKASSNVVIQTEQTVKYSAFQANVKALIEAEIEEVKIEEIEINADVAQSILKQIHISCPEFSSQRASVFMEKGSGQIRMWIVAFNSVFDICLCIFRLTREYMSCVSEFRAELKSI